MTSKPSLEGAMSDWSDVTEVAGVEAEPWEKEEEREDGALESAEVGSEPLLVLEAEVKRRDKGGQGAMGGRR